MTRVCVAGAGAIGSLFAAHLARVADVSALVRRPEHAYALRERGLRISGRANFTSRLDAATSPDELGTPELVILACKGTDLATVAAGLAGHWPEATLMTVQNGIGADETVAQYGPWKLLTAVTFMSGTRHDDTHVEYVLDTATWIGPARGTTPADAQRVAELIVSSGLAAEAFDDLRPAQWSKLVFNATVNTVAALTGLPHDPHFAAVGGESDLGHLVRDLMNEGKAVAAAAGVPLRGPLGDECARDATWERPLSVDARGRRGASPDGDRDDHRRPRTRGRPGRRSRAAAQGDAAPDQGQGGLLVRVCIVGCGAVGSLFAANLATLDDVEVWAYDLAQAHVDAINRDGLRLTGAGEVSSRPRATSDASEIPACSFGIVATKAMHTAPAIAATAHAFADGSVATVQNGIGNEEVLAEHVERVIRGTTFPAGKITAPGVVQWDVKGDTTFGPFEPKPAPLEAVQQLADACTRGGMPASAVEDARGPQWRKVIFNAATNPLGALTGLTHGRLCEQPALRRLVSKLVDEGKAVAAAQGIVLDADPEELIDYAARPDVAYGHKASMLQDVEARRQTEVDYLNGGIAEFGRSLGVPTPTHESIWALVKGVEAAWQQ